MLWLIGTLLTESAFWLNAFEWEPTIDPQKIKADIKDIWRFYKPMAAYGDALKVNFIAELNDVLFDEGLVRYDRTKSPENTPSQWDDWDFAPKWNTGKAKYLWGEITKTRIEHVKFILPHFDRKDDRHIANMARRLKRCLLNVRVNTDTKSSYPSFEIIKKELWDDPSDALNMAMACANVRQILPIDFGQVKILGAPRDTSELQESILTELNRMGRESGFEDF